jgi:hypothetical protein
VLHAGIADDLATLAARFGLPAPIPLTIAA